MCLTVVRLCRVFAKFFVQRLANSVGFGSRLTSFVCLSNRRWTNGDTSTILSRRGLCKWAIYSSMMLDWTCWWAILCRCSISPYSRPFLIFPHPLRLSNRRRSPFRCRPNSSSSLRRCNNHRSSNSRWWIWCPFACGYNRLDRTSINELITAEVRQEKSPIYVLLLAELHHFFFFKVVRHRCPVCDFEAGKAADTIDHIGTAHKAGETHQCPGCGHWCANRATLFSHAKAIHLSSVKWQKNRPVGLQPIKRRHQAASDSEEDRWDTLVNFAPLQCLFISSFTQRFSCVKYTFNWGCDWVSLVGEPLLQPL